MSINLKETEKQGVIGKCQGMCNLERCGQIVSKRIIISRYMVDFHESFDNLEVSYCLAKRQKFL